MFCRCFLPPPFCSAHSPTGTRSTLTPGFTVGFRMENLIALDAARVNVKIVIDFFSKITAGLYRWPMALFATYISITDWDE